MMSFTQAGGAAPVNDDAVPDSNEEYTRIGEMAKTFGVTLRTLRFYEDKGLISPKRDGSTRLYSRRDRARLKLILLGRKVGFSLRDVKLRSQGRQHQAAAPDARQVGKAARPPAEAARRDRRGDYRAFRHDGDRAQLADGTNGPDRRRGLKPAGRALPLDPCS